MDGNIKHMEERKQLKDTVDSLNEILDSMADDIAKKEASKLDLCPPTEVAYADELVGSLIITNLNTIKLVTGYYASARGNSSTNGDNVGAEIVVETETLYAGDNEYANVGDVNGMFIGKFEYGIATTIYGVPGTGIPNPNEWERFNFKLYPWKISDTVVSFREKLNNGEYDDKITGGRDDR